MTQPSAEDPAQNIPTESERESAAPMLLRGRWLVVIRVACIVVALVALVIWVCGLPLRYAQLGAVCTVAPANCGDQQITPSVYQLFKDAGVPLSFYAAFLGTMEVLYALTYLLMGALLLLRRSDTRIGLLTAVLLITYAVAQTDADVVASAVPSLAAPANLLDPFSFICLALFLDLFPDGRFVPRWARWVLLVWIPLFLVVAVVSFSDIVPILFGFLFLSLGFQIYRYRWVSSPLQRQQTKWVIFGLLLGVLGAGAVITIGSLFRLESAFGLWGLFTANTLIYLFSACIPLSIGVAILRSRLWDIDTLINRTLVYGSLTALLAALYAGLIIGLQHLTGVIATPVASNPVILVVSTLAIAALVQPLRTWLQALIDRAFYRRKYDAEKTLAAFGASLGQEVDLEQIRGHMLAVVIQTMQPDHISLWLRPRETPPTEQSHRLEADR
jgi:hypothetical protein